MGSKTVVEELADANERIKALEGEKAAGLTQIEALTGEVEKAKADGKAALDLAAKAESEKADAIKALEGEKAEHGKTQGELSAAKADLAKVLANPAFAAAAKAGLVKGTEEGGSVAGKEFATRAEAEAAYRQINDAKERAAFRAKHKEILGL